MLLNLAEEIPRVGLQTWPNTSSRSRPGKRSGSGSGPHEFNLICIVSTHTRPELSQPIPDSNWIRVTLTLIFRVKFGLPAFTWITNIYLISKKIRYKPQQNIQATTKFTLFNPTKVVATTTTKT